MSTEPFRTLSQYNQWANQKLVAFLAQLGDAECQAPRVTFAGSISGVLHHLLISDSLTMATLAGDPVGYRPRDPLGEVIGIESLVQILYAKFSEWKTARVHLDRQIIEYLSVVTEPELEERLAYFDFHGERRKTPRWQLLTELFTHQAHHRGQLMGVLYGLGRPLGPLDFTAFLRTDDEA